MGAQRFSPIDKWIIRKCGRLFAAISPSLSSTLALFSVLFRFVRLDRFFSSHSASHAFSFRCEIYSFSAHNYMCFNYFKWLKRCNKFWCETSSNKLLQCVLLLLLLLLHSKGEEHASIHFRIDFFSHSALNTVHWKECGHTEGNQKNLCKCWACVETK